MAKLLLPLVALATLGFCVWVWFHGEMRSAASALAEARALLESAPPAEGGNSPAERKRNHLRQEALGKALRNLNEALALAQESSDTELRRAILAERAAIYGERDQNTLALEDCRAIIAEFGPDADSLELSSRLALELHDPGLALEYARMLRAIDGPSAEVLIGKCHVALADGPLAQMERLFGDTFADGPARNASRLAQKAAVFYPEERIRTATLDELFRSSRLWEDRRDILELVRAAAEHLELARGAFLRALQERPDGETIAGFQDLLLRAGADDEVADLGALALALRELESKTPVLARTAGALQRLGRGEGAKQLILAVRATAPKALQPEVLESDALRDELVEWCRLLDALELWNDLGDAAVVLNDRALRVDDTHKRQLARFFLAVTALGQDRPDSAQYWLSTLLESPLPRECDIPFRIWLVIAGIARAQGERTQERYALNSLTKSAPLEPEARLATKLGEAWLRLAEIQKEDGDLALAMPSFTHAMRLLPARARELEKRWHELGRQAFVERCPGPYGAWSFAAANLGNGDAARAQQEAKALLVQYPGLRPALELVAESAFRQRDHRSCVQASLTLLRQGQPSPEVSARLRQVPSQFFTPEDRVQWMRSDPKGSLAEVIQRLVLAGRIRVAVESATTNPPASLDPGTIVVVARTLADAGQWKQAHEALLLLEPESSEFQSCTGLVLRAGLHASRSKKADDSPLDQALQRVLDSPGTRDPEVFAGADSLLAAGRPERLRRVLDWITGRERSLTGEALLREAVLRAIERSAAPGDETLERSTPFFEDGRAELGRIVLAVDASDWSAVEHEARAVLQTPLARDPIQRILLAGLSADFRLVRSILESAELDRRDPALVLGLAALAACERAVYPDATGLTDELLPEPLARAVDPRTLLALVLAGEVRPWSAWALARWRELPEDARSEPWTAVMSALALLALGELDDAQAQCRKWTEPGLPPGAAVAAAWSTSARILEARPGPSDPEQALALELGWLRSSGLANSEDPALAELEAELLVRSDRREEGVKRLERALETRPADPALLAALARIEDVPGRRTRSIELYGDLFRSGDARVRFENLLGFLDALRAARDEGEISEARWWNELEALEAELPSEPALPREIAAFELGRPFGEDTEAARDRAYERLRRFRVRTMQAPVESLRFGEALRWTELYARNDPVRAVEFAWPELIAHPTEPDLWLGWAQALVADGRRLEALDYLEPIVYLAPEPKVALVFALLRYQVFVNAKDLHARLGVIARMGRGEPDPLLRFYRGIAQLGLERLDREKAFQDLEVWHERAANGLDDPRHGRTFALALQRAGFLDEALEVIGQTMNPMTRPFERDMLLALASLLEAQLREKAAEEAPGFEPGSDPAAAPAAAPDAEPAVESEAEPEGEVAPASD